MNKKQAELSKYIEDQCKIDPKFAQINEQMKNPIRYEFQERLNNGFQRI